jgi:hypothetical protein
MPQESYKDKHLLSDLTAILKDLRQGIIDLHRIRTLVIDETKIISFEDTYCKNCKEPCGRSNAEIYNCLMAKMKKNKTKRYDTIQQYTKEYLEQDLEKIIHDMKEKENHLLLIMEKIEKGMSHS